MKSTRPLLLAVLSLVIILMFFRVELYKTWFRDRVFGPIENISEQLTYMDPHERRMARLQNSYFISYNVAEYLRTNKKDSNALILLPPTDYMKESGVDFMVPEPAVFYLYTGMKSVAANNKGADKTNFAIVPQQGANLQVIELNDQNRPQILAQFRKYIKTN
ncbi:MAG TPA: hypothetical protein PL009_07035 [Flavipsychrobacter sp.]|nr:hypothetical protein [Flavipsychrobacter sp.]